MYELQYKFCSFQDDLLAKVVNEEPLDGTLFIFPNESSKKRAIRTFQKRWQFTVTDFKTMEELKELLFISERPLLKEEKRTLAFYASLSEEDKRMFRIHHYFQSIELAQNFFDLWEEFNEELVDEKKIDKVEFIKRDAELLEWQRKTYDQLVKIRTQYHDFINQKGFADIIFLFKPGNLKIENFHLYQRVIFVNQFYYTGLENSIIHEFQRLGKQIIIYYQLPPECVDQSNRNIKPFNLEQFTPYKTTKIHINECNNDFSTIIALLESLHNHRVYHIVDVSFRNNPYARFLSFNKFNLETTTSFSNTSIYKFLSTLQTLIENLLYEPQRNKILLSLQTVLDAVLMDEFFTYFISEETSLTPKEIQEKTLKFMYSLIDADYKYLDLENEFLADIYNKPGAAFIQAIIAFLKYFIEIENIADFIAQIDSAAGISIKDIVTDAEQQYSDIYDVFYRSLADFSSIEALGLIDNWDDYFETYEPGLKQANIAGGILKLFNDYMKFKNIRVNHDVVPSPRVEITDLQDTRNLQYQSIVILNVIEGQIPTARKNPFLFTERQRQLLNLKTYDDIKLWEKYYFFRLILNTPEVHLFTQKNIEKNIDISSFLEEIRLYFPQDKIQSRRVLDEDYYSIYQQFLTSNEHYHVDVLKTRNAEFYRIPLDVNADFENNQLNLTPYSLKVLKQNPFVYFVNYLAQQNEFKKEIDTDFSARLIGNIVHDIINEAWKFLIDSHIGPLFGYDFSSIDEKFLNQAINKILKRNVRYYYRIPHNHTYIYFGEILVPVIRQGVISFFQFLEILGLSKKALQVIPEKELGTGEEQVFKQILQPEDNALHLDVSIRGRADLCVEVLDDEKYFIFDYKTGAYDAEQLVFYELYYYLLDHPDFVDRISSYFYHIIDEQERELRSLYRRYGGKKIAKNDIFESFKQDIINMLENLKDSYFALPEKRSHLQLLSEITRADLYLTNRRADSLT